MNTHYALTRTEYERELDLTLAGSFPASDAPFWTLGVSAGTEPHDSPVGVSRPASIDVVVREGHRVGGTGLGSLAEAITMVAALPLAILLAGAPVIGVVRGISYAVAWLTAGG